ncbi:MAG TPA: hypothetical protein VE978_19125 [Chitinophagales bacterium]|nr:hypothetical protein [Chitinophagales bacterium]
MELLFTIILITHVAGGTLALIGAPIAIAVHKGGKTHRTAGKIFFWGMTTVFVTAVYMSMYHNIPFLFMIAFFSYQLVMSGYRALFYKKLHKGQEVMKLDWIIIGVAASVNVAMMGWGAWQFITFHSSIGIVSAVFGLIGLSFVRRDYSHFRNGTTDKNEWLFKHISGMIAGYIAAVTAFMVVNFSDQLPTLMVWFAPAVVGSPLISYFIAFYRKKFAKGKTSNELVTIRIATEGIN